MTLFGDSIAPAASMPSEAMRQPSMTMAPSPTKARSSRMQPWTMARWPISTSSPMMVGKPAGRCGFGLSQCTTLPSWILLRAPITIRLASARITQLYQTLASAPISTSPMIRQPGAMKALSWMRGNLPPNARIDTSGRETGGRETVMRPAALRHGQHGTSARPSSPRDGTPSAFPAPAHRVRPRPLLPLPRSSRIRR